MKFLGKAWRLVKAVAPVVIVHGPELKAHVRELKRAIKKKA